MTDSDALRVLEYSKWTDWLATRATTEAGRERVNAASPSLDFHESRVALAETREARGLRREGRLPGLRSQEDGISLLHHAREAGIPLLARELAILFRFLRSARDLKEGLIALPVGTELRGIGAAMPDVDDFLQTLELSIDERGMLLDSATPRLRVLRMDITEVKEKVRRGIERFARRADVRPLLRSPHASIRDGRYVLAVRAGSRGQVKGLYHDRSATGLTAYVEPEGLVEEQNQLRDLLIDEEREVERILWRLTHEALELLEPIAQLRDLVARYDFACARATVADELGMVEPLLVEEGGLEITDVRHPLLLAWAFERCESEDEATKRRVATDSVTPFSLRLGDDFDLMVLTGPNTGGKTVTLKAIGLVALLPRIGCFVPCAEGARVPYYPGVFADVGDEQDLTQSLSTFSGHIRTISHIVRDARPGSLVLLDELGSGTDPLEGEALSTALLDHLLRQELVGVVTTHLGRLKEFAGRRPRATNGSMQFDPETFRPTYRLILGIPGASNALRIARNLGLPHRILEEAERFASESGDQDASALYDELDRSRAELEKLRGGAEVDRRETARLRGEAEEIRVQLDRDKASLFVQAEMAAEARLKALATELEEPRRALLALGGKAAMSTGKLMEAIRRALGSGPLAEHRKKFAKGLEPGDRVLLPRFNELCKVRRVLRREGKVEVDYRSMSVTVEFDEIAPPDPFRLSGLDGKK